MNTKLFRQVSIDRLSSPEQLDQVLRVTSFRTWLAITAVFSVLAVTCVWGFTGSIPSSAIGEGLIIRRGGVFNVVAQSSGVILKMQLKPGDRIKANQVIATVAQPILAEKLLSMNSALQDAEARRVQNLEIQKNAATFQVAAFERQRVSIDLQMRQMADRAKATTDRIPAEEQLLAKGLITKQQVLEVRQAVASLEEQMEGLRVQLKQIDSQEYAAKAQPDQSDATMQANIAAIERDIAGVEKEMGFDSAVVSPSGGEVVEVKVYAGSSVTTGQPLLSIQPDENSLEVVAYLPAAYSKDTRSGLEVQVSPLNIKPEEYGFLKGDVTFVADYPSTPEALLRNFENQSLVDALTRPGPVTEVRASLRRDPSTFSGFQWSTSKGPNLKISSGTICLVQVVTRRQAPATVVFPYMKKKLGLS
jgi:HlyD family secretion protein